MIRELFAEHIDEAIDGVDRLLLGAGQGTDGKERTVDLRVSIDEQQRVSHDGGRLATKPAQNNAGAASCQDWIK